MAFWTVQGGLEPKLKDRFLVIINGSLSFTAKSVTKPTLTLENKEYKMINHHFKYPGLPKWNTIKITFIDGSARADFKDKTQTTEEFVINNNLQGTAFDFRGMEDGSKPSVPSFSADTASELWQVLRNASYGNPDTTKSPSKEDMTAALGDVKIQQISPDVVPDPTGGLNADGKSTNPPKAKVVEEWKLINPIIKSVSWGDLAYGDDGLVQYELELDYDYAVLSRGHNALGSA